MRPWVWVGLICLAVAAHYLLPADWRSPILFVIGMFVLSSIGAKFDDAVRRITFLEAEVKALESVVENLQAEVRIDIPEQIHEVEKRMGKQSNDWL